ncbi:MAG TPA: PIG-L deacetylase family protein [Candidatus Limnocylindrales bacterium]
MKVLVIAAHPDDEVLGPGGTILRHVAAGDEVAIHVAVAGSNLRYDDAASAELYATSRAVAERLGATLTLGTLPDQALDTLSLPEVERVLGEVIVREDPELLLLHHPGDLNRDHRILFEAAMVAARPYAAPGVRAIHCFETPSSTEWGAPAALPAFAPNRFVDVTATLEAKIAAFALYESEVRDAPHPRALASLEARARAWGATVGLAAAEPFVVIRERW